MKKIWHVLTEKFMCCVYVADENEIIEGTVIDISDKTEEGQKKRTSEILYVFFCFSFFFSFGKTSLKPNFCDSTFFVTKFI